MGSKGVGDEVGLEAVEAEGESDRERMRAGCNMVAQTRPRASAGEHGQNVLRVGEEADRSDDGFNASDGILPRGK